MLEDLENLVTEEERTIAGKKFVIKPLSFYDVMGFIKRLNKQKASITQENFWQLMIDNVLDYLPELIANCASISDKQIKKMPASVALELAIACIEINQKSQVGLEDNLKKLMTMVTQVIQKASVGKLAS